MSYDTPYARWAGVGPYYAMFPTSFADQVVDQYTQARQRVLDPFAGRASSVFAAAARGRPAVGIEINSVGWIYGKVKLRPAPRAAVEARIGDLMQRAGEYTAEVAGDLAEFFRRCFADPTLCFLKACRDHLDWRRNATDRTLMALILVDLHGHRTRSFSNQMSQSKAMNPEYSVAWWERNQTDPPQLDVAAFLLKKVQWRYAKGVPGTFGGRVEFGDSCEIIQTLDDRTPAADRQRFSLLLTSPPYIGITDYHRDQWLRLWLLGGNPTAARLRERHKGAFASHTAYRTMLETVFRGAAAMMSPSGYVYVRTDARPATFEITQEVLRAAFPGWREQIIDQPAPQRSQTARFGDTSPKPGEKDIILTGPAA